MSSRLKYANAAIASNIILKRILIFVLTRLTEQLYFEKPSPTKQTVAIVKLQTGAGLEFFMGRLRIKACLFCNFVGLTY